MSFITVHLPEHHHPLYWLERWSAFAGTPTIRCSPRPSAEGEAGGREESQFITQQPDRPKEGEEDFNSSLGSISLVGTNIIVKWIKLSNRQKRKKKSKLTTNFSLYVLTFYFNNKIYKYHSNYITFILKLYFRSNYILGPY